MMTFLEYVCRQLMGEPAYGLSWCCPFHDDHHPSFYLRTKLPKPRYRCFACSEWGDECDLLKHFFPREDYQQRLDRLAQMRREFEAEGGKVVFHTREYGEQLLWSLLARGSIDEFDLREVIGELNHRRNLEIEHIALSRQEKPWRDRMKAKLKKPRAMR